jgi:hypothetical protein
MAKSLRNITLKADKTGKLAGVKSSHKEPMDLSDWEASKGGRDFASRHKIEHHADRVGNHDDAYESGDVKTAKYPKQDKNVYESMKCESCGKSYESKMCGCGGNAVKAAVPGGGKGMIADKKKISEGAKVDRMEKHIEDSEKASGKSTKVAKSIAWATLNKRGFLDNKNKKMHEAKESEEVSMVTTELKAMINDAEELLKSMPEGMHVEPWVQAKVAMAKASICSIHDYIIYGNVKEDLAIPMLEGGKKKVKKTK